jgi:hypothetical protein
MRNYFKLKYLILKLSPSGPAGAFAGAAGVYYDFGR